jgi:hypothetical protein
MLTGIIIIGLYYSLFKREEKKQMQIAVQKNPKCSDDILSDKPTVNDKIGFNDYADVLSQSINESADFKVYGIFGHWGTGKTSLMYMLKDLLKEENKIIWFDAWRFKGKDISIFDALCNIIYDELKDELNNSYIKSALKSVIEQLNKRKKTPSYIVRKLNSRKSNFEKVVKYLNRNKCKKIVIFVDDLDRCKPSEAVEFLENLKVFLDISQVIFVIGADYDIICNEINKQFKEIVDEKSNYSEEYLSKIINVPFFIPEIDKETIKHYIKDNVQIESIIEISHVLATGLEKNLRTIKRAVSYYLLLLKIAERRLTDISNILLAKTLVIKIRYRSIYNKILINKNYILELQDIATNEAQYFNELWQNKKRKSNSILNTVAIKYESTKEVNKGIDNEVIPDDLKALLRIEPYFEKGTINKYIQLLQEEDTQESNKQVIKEEQYIREFINNKLSNIPTLSVFSKDTRKEISAKLIKDFKQYDISNQHEILRLLRSSLNPNINDILFELLSKNEIDDISLKKEISNILLQSNYDISKYVEQLYSKLDQLNINDQSLLLDICITAIQNKKKFYVDILAGLIDKLDFIESDYESREKIVDALGVSGDKKSLDLLVKFIDDKSKSVSIKVINSIGKLDSSYLLSLYDQFASDENLRNPYFTALLEYAKDNEKLSNYLYLDDLTRDIEKEDDESLKILEIKLLTQLVKIYATNKVLINHVEYLNVTTFLEMISRRESKWQIRDEAEKALAFVNYYEKMLKFDKDELPF